MSTPVDTIRPLTYIDVDLDAIAHNVRAVRAHIGPGRGLIAVVKANAYGHGLLEVARVMLNSGANHLAVARVGEGLALRAGGITAPVLVMSYAAPDEIAPAVESDLTLAIGDWDTVAAIAARADTRHKTASVHLKLDTGMGRFGLLPDEVPPFMSRLAALSSVRLTGIFTHFATADAADKSYAHEQFAVYQRAMATIRAAGHAIPLRHVANSGATLDLPEMHLDAVRPGIILYGLYPSAAAGRTIPIRPAMTVKSRVGRIRTLPAGVSIGYDRTYFTPREMPVALIPIGYGDGYPRLLTGQGEVLINGRRARLVGRVAMDTFVVDISDVGPVALNDEVVLLGPQDGDCITAEELAVRADTNNYQIITSLLPRLPRFYI
jgi:alanine racemase